MYRKLELSTSAVSSRGLSLYFLKAAEGADSVSGTNTAAEPNSDSGTHYHCQLNRWIRGSKLSHMFIVSLPGVWRTCSSTSATHRASGTWKSVLRADAAACRDVSFFHTKTKNLASASPTRKSGKP